MRAGTPLHTYKVLYALTAVSSIHTYMSFFFPFLKVGTLYLHLVKPSRNKK